MGSIARFGTFLLLVFLYDFYSQKIDRLICAYIPDFEFFHIGYFFLIILGIMILCDVCSILWGLRRKDTIRVKVSRLTLIFSLIAAWMSVIQIVT